MIENIKEALFSHLATIDFINKEIQAYDKIQNKTIEDYNVRIDKLQKFYDQLTTIGNFIFGLSLVEDNVEYVSEVMIIIFVTIFDKVEIRLNNSKRKRGLLNANKN